VRQFGRTEEGVELRKQIVALAKQGVRPMMIYNKFAKHCDYRFVGNTIERARRAGEQIPDFRNFKGNKREPKPAQRQAVSPESLHCAPPAIPAPPPAPKIVVPETTPPARALPHALDYFELRALRKLLGSDLPALTDAAEAQGISLSLYCREILAGHARRFKP
jgi:hypothetical protein